jgi:hypothetical protein
MFVGFNWRFDLIGKSKIGSQLIDFVFLKSKQF